MPFKKATKTRIKLRLAIEGPAGSGKTYTALAVATDLEPGGRIAVIDTERGSASKYADLFAFDVLELDSFHPSKYVDAIAEAALAGYAVVVIDSLSHAWDGKGGILEIVRRKGNSFNAWGDVAPIEDALLDALTGANIHIIATMRTKTAYEVEKDEKTGKMQPRKVGLAAVQRQGLEYEFDVVGRLDDENTWTTTKTRCPALTGALISKPGKPLAETLRAWLTGAPVETPSTAPKVEPAPYAEDDEDDDTITYTPELEPPTEREWHPLEDPKFITSLRDIKIVNVADQESFVASAGKNHPQETLREACRLEYVKRFNAQQKAKSATRGRGPHALAATSSEPVPESLESLPTGRRAS